MPKKIGFIDFFGLQWAKLASHANKDVGGVAQMHIYKYADFIFTCPILVSEAKRSFSSVNCRSYAVDSQTIDLLGTLNLPVNLIQFPPALAC
jgi:hypothetical protein